MNVLVLGSGGREHAISWKLAQSSKVGKLFVAPGNSGTEQLAENLDVGVNDFQSLAREIKNRNIEMVVVGPEDPLVNGFHDFVLQDEELKHINVVGPLKAAAMLEGSKDFAKRFMKNHGIPTAAYESFTSEDLESAYSFLEQMKPPYVLKADGLAAGKGVLIIDDLDLAKKELRAMLVDSKFGKASSTVVIEEFLSGIELSCFVLTDGDSYKILPYAKDYKRIGEGDTGLNTGGMGAISPVPFASEDFLKKVEHRIVIPTVEGLKKDGLPYKGFIFIGLIKVGEDPYVIEYNVRMGDPETEVVIPRIKSDLAELFNALQDGSLSDFKLEIDQRTASTVMLVSGGYPEAYEKGKTIVGVEEVQDSIVFHAGAKRSGNDLLTSGGRVLAVTSFGNDHKEALSKSYQSIDKICFENMNFRKDIGFDL